MHKKHRIFLFVMSFLILVVGVSYAEEYNIGIMMWKTAETYEETMEGLQRGLKESGITINQDVMNAHGNQEIATEIFQKFNYLKKDLIIAFGTHGGRIGHKEVKDLPLVVLGGNTPVGLIDTFEKPGGNMTGSSYYIDPVKQLAYFRKIVPKIQRIGMIYNPANGASLIEVPATKKECDRTGVTFVESQILRAVLPGVVEGTKGVLEGYDTFVKKIPAAVEMLIGKVDAIVIPTNSELYDNIEYVLAVTVPQKIPVFSYAEKGVRKGALAGMTADNRKLGFEAADMVKRILKDKEYPGDISFTFCSAPDRLINIKAAKAIGVHVPIYAIRAASEVIQ